MNTLLLLLGLVSTPVSKNKGPQPVPVQQIVPEKDQTIEKVVPTAGGVSYMIVYQKDNKQKDVV